MIDTAARQQLQSAQTARAISDGIDKIATALKQTSVVAPQSQKTPANDVADELRNLQKMIGGGNLTESLLKLSKSLESFDVNENALGQLKTLVADMSAKLRLLAEIEAKLPSEVQVKFPKQFPVTGTVDVGTVDSLPPVHVVNLDEVGKEVGMLINNLQVATIKAIQASKPEFPKSMQVGEVSVKQFSELLDGIEELKKGFNLLINKEVATVGFPDKMIPVEIQNWKVPQPVTNVSINPSRGTVLATAVTVTATLTPLPGTALADRRSMTIYNNSDATTIYVGGANVTSATGIPVLAGSYGPALDAGPRNIVYAVTSSGSANVRVLEMNDLMEGGDA